MEGCRLSGSITCKTCNERFACLLENTERVDGQSAKKEKFQGCLSKTKFNSVSYTCSTWSSLKSSQQTFASRSCISQTELVSRMMRRSGFWGQQVQFPDGVTVAELYRYG